MPVVQIEAQLSTNQLLNAVTQLSQRELEQFSTQVIMQGEKPLSIQALQLNREELVNLRRVLYAMGEHPPVRLG